MKSKYYIDSNKLLYNTSESDFVLLRPKLSIRFFAFEILLIGFFSGVCIMFLKAKILPTYIAISLIILIYIIISLKRLTIKTIRVYQRYASIYTRIRCPLYPSCSEYMIISIKKYGIFKGVLIGIKRLKRCSPPSRVDMP